MSDEGEFLRPFEWLTDSPSVIPVVKSAIAALPSEGSDSTKNNISARILHVGSGSSVLGEYLVENLEDSIEQIVNVDLNAEMLQKMEAQWNTKHKECETVAKKLQFIPTDFDDTASSTPLSFPDGYFHVAVDKGTLDCTLCSDSTTAGLLSEVYRVLHPQGGTYIVISFHHIDLLRPLLENIPGAEWDVSFQKMNRQMDDLVGTKNGTVRNQVPSTTQSGQPPISPVAEINGSMNGVAWASGTFEPDEQYIKTLSVIICRRIGNPGGISNNFMLDRDALMEHVNKTNDKWFQEGNPMLTDNRKREIRQLFQTHNTNSSDTIEGQDACDVKVAYEMIFTEAEREHFTYDLFLEDWDAWLEKKSDPSLSRDTMSLASALEFLQEMQ